MDRATIKAKAREQLGGGIFTSNWIMAVVAILLSSLILSAGSTVIIGSLLLAGPMAYAMDYMFLKQARDNEKMELGDLFKGFQVDFVGTFLLGLMQSIFILLWCLIPVAGGIIGTVKSYSYSMSFFIKVDHPEYTWSQCITESRQLMDGHKLELFIQDLSFIGWAIVGCIACGIGSLWVSAYVCAARAQFYRNLVPEKEANEI